MGKSIRIYLAETDVSGIRHAEIVNWTGQALAFPRNRVSELKGWPEAHRQGVYFLLGIDEQSGQEAVYIGEAEIVAGRIVQHLTSKDFWSECVAFTSKDENLTKSHIKYLEARLVAAAITAGRYVVKNASTPQESALPRADKDAMDEFAEHVRTLLGVLGHRVLDPTRISPPIAAIPVSAPGEPAASPATVPVAEFKLTQGGLLAASIRSTDGLVVLTGSTATKDVASSLSIGYRTIRDTLISTGVLVDAENRLKFSRDHAFPSPSQAAAVVLGYMVNGRAVWKAEDGRSYAQIEETEAGVLDEQYASETA